MKIILKSICGILACLFLFCTQLIAQPPTDWTPRSAQKWAKTRTWSHGWPIRPHRSTDFTTFARQYELNQPLWDQAFAFLSENDLNSLPLGTHQIVEGRCWATVSEYTPKDTQSGNIESHRKFIDLQYTLSGEEKMGLAPADAAIRTPYNEARDIAFYTSDRVKYYKTSPAVFFLFFPSDIHQPSVQNNSTTPSRKIVLKIEYIE